MRSFGPTDKLFGFYRQRGWYLDGSSQDAPMSVRDVQCFLGFANFYRRFIHRYSQKCRLLYDLIRKDKAFSWTPEHSKIFEALKEAFCTAPILRHFDPSLETIVETDTSDFAAAGVLSQRFQNPMDQNTAVVGFRSLVYQVDLPPGAGFSRRAIFDYRTGPRDLVLRFNTQPEKQSLLFPRRRRYMFNDACREKRTRLDNSFGRDCKQFNSPLSSHRRSRSMTPPARVFYRTWTELVLVYRWTHEVAVLRNRNLCCH
jgi:hypothetical protein